jgi:hypothetical protein
MHLGKALGSGIGAVLLVSAPVRAETRGYVISWFATATNAANFKINCPQDKNGGRTEWTIRDLRAVGYTQEQAVEIVKNAANSTELPADITRKMDTRATVNGHPVSIYNYPEAVADPNIETVSGKFAYGFDLGGSAANKFEDPETHQMIDDQLWRAVGCTESFRAVPPVMPYPEELAWNTMVDSAPGWAMQITGDDLSRDGKVTITLDRTTQHLERDSTGSVMSNASYIIDVSPRSHNVLQGEIKDGVLTIKPAKVRLQGEMPYYGEIAIRDTRMRINMRDDKLTGYWGGYINWINYIYMYTSRPANGSDSIGLYHAIKKMADADPDPKTGQNREISATFRMEALPSYLATLDGKIIAVAASGGLRPAVAGGTNKSQ